MKRLARAWRRPAQMIGVLALAGAISACGSDDPVGLNSGRISGRVYVDNLTNGLGGVTLMLTGQAAAQTTTGSDGSYLFQNLGVGQYTLTIVVPNGYQLASASSESRSIGVGGGGTASANFILTPTGEG